MTGGPKPTVAIAHDYLTQRGGAERVVLAMARAFPGARIYTTLYDPAGTYPEFADLDIVVSPLNKVRLFRRNHRLALPLLPAASDSIDIPEDIVVASSSGWAHGFRAAGTKVVYCHSPARWLYLTDEYVGTGVGSRLKSVVANSLKGRLTAWDQAAAGTAHRYLANSTVVRKRIAKVYGLHSEVLPPPHGVTTDGDRHTVPGLREWAPDGYHLVVSRLMPYKNVDRVAAAFAQLPDERLLVVGAGPLREQLVAQAPSNVQFVQNLSDAQMREAYAGAKALVAPSHEDFGLTPLEAGAFGKPVLALHAGGYLDTVVDGVTGLFFENPLPEEIADAVRAGAAHPWNVEKILEHVATFGEERFHAQLRDAVAEALPARIQDSFRIHWQHGGVHQEQVDRVGGLEEDVA